MFVILFLCCSRSEERSNGIVSGGNGDEREEENKCGIAVPLTFDNFLGRKTFRRFDRRPHPRNKCTIEEVKNSTFFEEKYSGFLY